MEIYSLHPIGAPPAEQPQSLLATNLLHAMRLADGVALGRSLELWQGDEKQFEYRHPRSLVGCKIAARP